MINHTVFVRIRRSNFIKKKTSDQLDMLHVLVMWFTYVFPEEGVSCSEQLTIFIVRRHGETHHIRDEHIIISTKLNDMFEIFYRKHRDYNKNSWINFKMNILMREREILTKLR